MFIGELTEEGKKVAEIKKAEGRLRSARRAKNAIRRNISCNLDMTKFYTLTFCDEEENLSKANKLFNDFCKRWRRKHPFVKYLAVPEIQKKRFEKTGKKVVHYHLLCDMKYLPSKHLETMWGNGFVKLRRLRDRRNLPYYLTKYLNKEEFVDIFFNKKRFFHSENIKIPLVLLNELADAVFDFVSRRFSLVYQSVYETMVGPCSYSKYFSDV